FDGRVLPRQPSNERKARSRCHPLSEPVGEIPPAPRPIGEVPHASPSTQISRTDRGARPTERRVGPGDEGPPSGGQRRAERGEGGTQGGQGGDSGIERRSGRAVIGAETTRSAVLSNTCRAGANNQQAPARNDLCPTGYFAICPAAGPNNTWLSPALS